MKKELPIARRRFFSSVLALLPVGLTTPTILIARNRPGDRISTSLQALDDITGGLPVGEVTLLTDPPNFVSTLLASRIAVECLRRGDARVTYFDLQHQLDVNTNAVPVATDRGSLHVARLPGGASVADLDQSLAGHGAGDGNGRSPHLAIVDDVCGLGKTVSAAALRELARRRRVALLALAPYEAVTAGPTGIHLEGVSEALLQVAATTIVQLAPHYPGGECEESEWGEVPLAVVRTGRVVGCLTARFAMSDVDFWEVIDKAVTAWI